MRGVIGGVRAIAVSRVGRRRRRIGLAGRRCGRLGGFTGLLSLSLRIERIRIGHAPSLVAADTFRQLSHMPHGRTRIRTQNADRRITESHPPGGEPTARSCVEPVAGLMRGRDGPRVDLPDRARHRCNERGACPGYPTCLRMQKPDDATHGAVRGQTPFQARRPQPPLRSHGFSACATRTVVSPCLPRGCAWYPASALQTGR